MTLMEVHLKFSICGTDILHVQIGFLMIMVLEFVLVKLCWLVITTTWQLTNPAEVVWGDEFFRLLSQTKSSQGSLGRSYVLQPQGHRTESVGKQIQLRWFGEGVMLFVSPFSTELLTC